MNGTGFENKSRVQSVTNLQLTRLFHVDLIEHWYSIACIEVVMSENNLLEFSDTVSSETQKVETFVVQRKESIHKEESIMNTYSQFGNETLSISHTQHIEGNEFLSVFSRI